MVQYIKPPRMPVNGSDIVSIGDANSDFRSRVSPAGAVSVEMYSGQYGAARTVERTPLFQLRGGYGISALRDEVVTISGGSINDTGDTITVSGNHSSYSLISSEHARLLPGVAGEGIITIKVVEPLTGSQELSWGFFDPLAQTSGVAFGCDSTGYFIKYIIPALGLNTKVPQVFWSVDKLDGTGPSGITLDLGAVTTTTISEQFSFDTTTGHSYIITVMWEYGQILFSINALSLDGLVRPVLVHIASLEDFPANNYPNTPIAITLDNGPTPGSVEASAIVLSRSFNLIGKFIPSRRINSERVIDKEFSTVITPLMSVRRKEGKWDGLSIKMSSFDLATTGDTLVELRLNGTLTGDQWGNLTNTTASETAMESDVTASGIVGGELLWAGLSSGIGTNFGSNEPFDLDLPPEGVITLCAAASQSDGTCSSVLRWREEW